MPWEFNWPRADRVPAHVRPNDVLYAFDEPLIYVANMGFFDALCSKIDELNGRSLILVCGADDQMINALKGGMISVRGAFHSKNYWIVDVGVDYSVDKAWSVPAKDIPESFLPKKSYGLHPAFGRVPDTIELAKAFFGIKFSGSQLHADQMSFQTFKNLVDSAFATAKSLITPHIISNYRSNSVFDMPIAQPTFSSLAISIMKPDMDIAVINSRYAKRTDLYSKADIVQASAVRRGEFFDKAGELVEEANRGRISDSLAADSFDWLETILEVAPSPHKDIDDVEFTAVTNVGRSYLHIGENVGAEMRQAYERAATQEVVLRGVIVEVNGDAATFVVRNLQTHRQVTCVLSEEMFRRLDRAEVINRGARLALRGNFTRRARRDLLHVTADPQALP